MTNIESRVNNLESKFTMQDDLIDQLNQIITEQQFKVDKLEFEIKALKGTLEMGTDVGTGTSSSDKPPHY